MTHIGKEGNGRKFSGDPEKFKLFLEQDIADKTTKMREHKTIRGEPYNEREVVKGLAAGYIHAYELDVGPKTADIVFKKLNELSKSKYFSLQVTVNDEFKNEVNELLEALREGDK